MRRNATLINAAILAVLLSGCPDDWDFALEDRCFSGEDCLQFADADSKTADGDSTADSSDGDEVKDLDSKDSETSDGDTTDEEVCVPDCTDKVCGSNNCGGTCGQCEQQERMCVDGVCVQCLNDEDCDDKNACTTDACNTGLSKCVHQPIDGCLCEDVECDDKNICTTDSCDLETGDCSFVANSDPCEDGDLCTVDDFCKDTSCQSGELNLCNDDDECTADSCDAETGNCVHEKIEGCGCVPNCEGKTCGDDGCKGSCGECGMGGGCGCEDGDYVCQGQTGECSKDGQCALTDKEVITCNDENPCTTDSCGDTGCVNAPNTLPCDDESSCTTDDTCNEGVCQGTWNSESCPCEKNDDCVDDGNLCNGTPVCDLESNTCVIDEETVVSCSGDVLPCQALVCVPDTGSCAAQLTQGFCLIDDECFTHDTVNEENQCQICNAAFPTSWWALSGVPCDDGLACTVGELCLEGVCPFGEEKVCDDENVCTSDSCDPDSGDCVFSSNTLACEKDVCTVNSQCADGSCQGGEPKVCDDGDPCTWEYCTPSNPDGCYSELVDCSEDDDACVKGKCFGNGDCEAETLVECSSKPCHTVACDGESGDCVYTKFALEDQKVTCNDDNSCTTDYCDDSGTCQNDLVPDCMNLCEGKTCEDTNPCTTDLCDSDTGECIFGANSEPCDDGDPCTFGDVCADKVCLQGDPVECEEDDACITGVTCTDGECGGGIAKDCSDGNACTDDSCDSGTGECVYVNNTVGCSDGVNCTVDDVCQDGTCSAGKTSDAVCDDGNPCTIDLCSASDGCIYTEETNEWKLKVGEETFHKDDAKKIPKENPSELLEWLNVGDWALGEDFSTKMQSLVVSLGGGVGSTKTFTITNSSSTPVRVRFYVHSYYNYFPDQVKGSVALVQGEDVKCTVELPTQQKLCDGIIATGEAQVVYTEGEGVPSGKNDVTLSNQGIRLDYHCSE